MANGTVSAEQTTGTAGSAPLTTVTQQISNTCNKHVTPAPEYAIGTIDYYYDSAKENSTAPWLSRYFDFLDRHQTCNHSVPDYYHGYGDKYIRKFTNELSPKLSDIGKEWLIKARKLLQQYMEDGFNTNIKSTDITTQCRDYPKASARVSTKTTESLELDSDNFRTFAFGTHPPAYIDAGLGKLPLTDLISIGNTPDFKEWLKLDSWAQFWQIVKYLGHDKIEKIENITEKMLQDIKDAGINIIDGIIQQGKDAIKRELRRKFDDLFRFPTMPSLF